MDDHDLPLKAQPRRDAALPAESEREIARLVEHFYQLARQDPKLGPVFDAHVKDWDQHLATMCRFWSSVVYRTGTYAGNPLRVHAGVPEITPQHFEHWLRLWDRAVGEVVAEENRPPFLAMAQRMGASMSSRLGMEGE